MPEFQIDSRLGSKVFITPVGEQTGTTEVEIILRGFKIDPDVEHPAAPGATISITGPGFDAPAPAKEE